MANIKFDSARIVAISACVPKNVSSNFNPRYEATQKELLKSVNTIGIKEKRFVDQDVCASDLCVNAALQLFKDNDIDPGTIDVLLFLSQTPDHKIPATSPILQDKLGLSKSTACLDLGLGCSGYVYSLSTAFAYASMNGVNRVLLLVGDTFSKIVNPEDKINAPLYGDAGTATLIEKDNNSESFFHLMSDGSGYSSIMLAAGQCRLPYSNKTTEVIEVENGSKRSDSQLYMNGMDVFNFTLKVIPKAINEVLSFGEKSLDEIDLIVLHQANKFITDFLIKKLKYDTSKVPYCLEKYGNTSSPSIPLTISSELSNSDVNMEKVILCGFGAGLSWGSVILDLSNTNISGVIEYER
jgi:3-oxoacyl-[acyl-carrier-protein] synthase-3